MAATPHVAVLAFPFGSHAAPLLTLVRKLAMSAPSATFSFLNTIKSNGSIASIIASCASLSNVKICDVWDGVEEGYVPKGRNPLEAIELFLKAMPGNFREALRKAVATTGDVTCVLSDAFMWIAEEMATEIGVPWVTLATAGPASVAAHLYTDLIRETIGVGEGKILLSSLLSLLISSKVALTLFLFWFLESKSKLDELLNCVPCLLPARVRDLPHEILTADVNSPFACLLHGKATKFPLAKAVVFNSFDGLDPPILNHLKTKLQKCLPVGPFHLSAPLPPEPDVHGSLTWLDRLPSPASVAYVSFGTVMSPPPPELAALAEGIEASGAYFLWSLRDAARANLPEGFVERTKDRGLIVSWAPQTRVLLHPAVGVFVTHCGWNSMVESIASGVPMMCRPFLGEQMIMSRMLEEVMGVGLAAKDGVLTKEGVVDSLDLILQKAEGKTMREKVKALKAIAEEAVSEGGSSTRNFQSLLEMIVSKA
ncbi:anthocyanidin 3-O-glucosyltransferase 7-like [Aristolochia californica]|uniref:anthocyanidin 3-O-glucosyltransferase 7-like n=1 Tax=Aristolochia californica TaxID=171875 RepID=UPI0035D53E01